ncbi:type VII toxin-antitoxin system MntA family adenylyltransferase antitoxin [Litchfieldella qijiaojingensis]|uniref:type VII toxin-antitoxin system MntA family adenylyltransferase antitoxin n=1 Tax=Litchfieldella qijiaojingensis TaxID=980347 RepID=UPI001E5FB8D3|nr:nucleotidyltransferase domain-containing protein [Halomonas qijiaojingensis]
MASHEVMLASTKLEKVITAFPDLEQVILFGSVANGQAHESSDVDVAVQAAQPLTAERRLEMIDALALAFDRPVDLIDLASAGEPLLSQIVTTGVRIKGSDAAWGQLIYKNIMENTDFVPLQQHILTTRQRAWIGK